MLEELSATIEKIYAAAAGSASWKDALVAVEDLTGSTGAVINLTGKGPNVEFRTIAGSFSDANCAEYSRDYQAICPRIRHAMANPNEGTQFDYLFMTEAEMDRDPVYHWFGTHGLRYYLGSTVAETPNYFTFMSLQRTRRQGHAQSEDVELFDLLKPHVARATSLADQLGTLRSYQCFGSAMLEALPQAVFALDRNGLVLFANLAARQLIAGGNAIGIDAGLLRFANPMEQSRLDLMIRNALAPIGAPAPCWTRVSRPAGGPPFAVFVAPLTIADEEFAAAGAKALVMVHDTADHRCASVEMLTSVYGLTETEARLASALSGGHSIESASVLLQMKPATARSHLKAVFRKTDVGRQQDLVRLLASISTISAAQG